jgi:hypothetical protein
MFEIIVSCVTTCTRHTHVSLQKKNQQKWMRLHYNCIPSLRRTSAGSKSLVTVDNRMARFFAFALIWHSDKHVDNEHTLSVCEDLQYTYLLMPSL